MTVRHQRVVGIGPLSPPTTGPGLKNTYLKQGLEAAGFQVQWVDTLNRSPRTVFDLIRRCHKEERFLVSASTKVRFGTAPLLARKLSSSRVKGALLPAGGAFATEINNLPPVIRRRYIRWFGEFDCIFPQTHRLAGELGALFDGAVCISTLPNLRPVPTEPPIFTPYSPDRLLRLVYVGRIKETKGLDYLLAAVKEINTPDARVSLDVYGHFLSGDEYKNQFMRVCANTPNAEFQGPLKNENVVSQLQEYDVFAFPTFYPGEGFPGVFVEAFASGCLVIASNWKANREIISEGKEGLLFEPKNAPDLRRTLEWLLDNPPAVNEYKRNSWDKAQQFSVEAVTADLVRDLQRVGW